ncbi:MAG: hypothetical protein ACP5M9_01955 [Candidatus Micrarchaeia archaeon]
MENGELIILKEKQIKILLLLLKQEKNNYISDIAKITGVSYVHTSRFLSACEDKKLISYEKHGKIKSIFLTDKGKEVASYIEKILEITRVDKKQEEKK